MVRMRDVQEIEVFLGTEWAPGYFAWALPFDGEHVRLGVCADRHAARHLKRPYAELFPMIRHAARTTGFFKIRGVNVNHAEFEDFMFRHAQVNDFQGVLVTGADALETLRVRIEVRRGADGEAVAGEIAGAVKHTFEVTPEVEVLELGTLAKAFESSIKAPRFVDQRE